MPLIDPSTGTNPDQYSALLTTTLQNFRSQIVDNFSDATPCLWWLSQNERKRHLRGGTNIEVPLMYSGASVQAFSGYDKLVTEPTEGIAPATFLWKKYQVPVVISRDHETDNMGESQIVSLVEAKVKQAEISFTEEINYDLINNGYTGKAAIDTSAAHVDNMRVVGLTDVCQDTPSARQYGGISGSTYAWWKNQFFDQSDVGVANITDLLRKGYLNAARGNDAPDLILCSQGFYENYDASLVTNKRFVNTMAADNGFESLMYRGSTMLYDRDVPDSGSGMAFMLNSNYISLYVHPDVDMQPTPFREAENQWARYSRILWKGALVCSNRARQCIVDNNA
ncbi:MAG: phage major capsid protein [Dehalococcoidia bacterium]